MGVVGAASDQILGHLEAYVLVAVEPVDDLANLGHDLRTDTVSGEDQKGRIGHGQAPVLALSRA